MKNLERIILSAGILHSAGCKDPDPNIERTVEISSAEFDPYCWSIYWLENAEESCETFGDCRDDIAFCTPSDTIATSIGIEYKLGNFYSGYSVEEPAPAEEIEKVQLSIYSLPYGYASYDSSVDLLDSVFLSRDEEDPYTFAGSFTINEYNVICEDEEELFMYLFTVAVTYSIPVEDYYTFTATKEVDLGAFPSFYVHDEDCRE